VTKHDRSEFKSVAAAGLAAALLLGPCAAPGLATEPMKPPKIGANLTSYDLDNGLKVVLIPDRRAPVVTHMIWYKIGAADEPRGKSGIAHYLEHLMFKGTRAHPEGEFSKVIASVGGQENAFTSDDYTAYYQKVPKAHLRTMMEFESDRMQNLVLTEAVALPERKVILEERSMRVDNNPSAQLREAMNAAMYRRSPYRIPIIGWRKEMEGLTYKDAIAFYDRYYTPNNAILVVAGDIDIAGTKKMISDTYGKLERRADPGPRIRASEPRISAELRVVLRNQNVSQPAIRKGWVVPSYATASGNDAEALDVLASVLGGGTTSRIYKSLVVKQKIASAAGAWYQSNGLGDTQMLLYATPANGVSMDKVEEALLVEVEKIKSDGISAEELTRAINKMMADTIYGQDSQANLARTFGATLTTGSTIEEVQNWPAAVSKVTADDVKKAANAFLDPDIAVTGLLLPTRTTN